MQVKRAVPGLNYNCSYLFKLFFTNSLKMSTDLGRAFSRQVAGGIRSGMAKSLQDSRSLLRLIQRMLLSSRNY